MRTGTLVLLAILGLAIAGCSEDEDPIPSVAGGSGGSGGNGGGGAGGGGGEAPEGCIPLQRGPDLTMNAGWERFHLEAKATPGLPGAHRTHLVFEIYDFDHATETEIPLELGTFALAEAPNDGYGTCQHCTLLVAFDRHGMPTRVFFQKSGEIEITKFDDEERTITAGTLRDVQLREVTQNPDFSWEDIPDSDCYWIGEWSFDTTPNNGASCQRAEDCANTALQVCNPLTAMCTWRQCSFTGDVWCPDGQVCVNQVPTDTTWGACYAACTPFTAGECPVDQICVPFGPAQTVGACKAVGSGEPGESCDEPDISTGCVYGSICAGEPAVCTKLCRYLSDDPGCPEGQLCGIDNICAAPAIGDPAALGAPCDPGSPPETGCGADGKAFAGLCLSLYPDVEELTCHELCRMGDRAGCDAGSYCAEIFANPDFGLCWRTPVCGDGVLDPLNEICDDGNAEAGDGCNADCSAAEFGPLCAAAPVLLLDETITGTTVGGPTGYRGNCRLYEVVPAAPFSFVPPGPGTLVLSVASNEANLDLVVLGDCADPSTELGCSSIASDTERLEIDFAAGASTPALVLVAGRGIRDAGAFELQAHFIPAICGDSIVAGPERCDDGNTSDGDGCSADCLELEWPLICAGLPQLSLDALNIGDTSSSGDRQRGAGLCAAWAGDDNDEMYRFTAPADGMLTLRLSEDVADHVVYVMNGCGPVVEWDDLIACSNFGAPDGVPYEELQLALSQGQEITVVVEGFLPGQRGAYELEAVFQ